MDDDAAIRRVQALARQQAAESRQAAALLKQFAADATAAGIAPERLTARGYRSKARYRTQVTGWYLRLDRSVGVGTDGSFYVLTAPDGLRSRLNGVTVAPKDPPLELGRGGRDGESMPLVEAIARRLDPNWRPN
jgi:hypothetical protein